MANDEANTATSEVEATKPNDEEQPGQESAPKEEQESSPGAAEEEASSPGALQSHDGKENSVKREDGEELPDSPANQSPDKPKLDPEAQAQNELIAKSTPTTPLEIAMAAVLMRKDVQIARLTGEVAKLKAFVSKRKQTYKRKRKDEGAPTRALSAYNIFIQDRFARLAKENADALKSESVDAALKRVPPANLVASTGNEWKELPAEEKAKYEER